MAAGRVLLDTNTASFIIRGQPAQVRERLSKVPMEQVGISVITEAELRYGAARRPEVRHLQRAVEEFLLRVEVLAWDRQCAAVYATLRAQLAARGRILGAMDLLIAAHALASDATLVTHDQAFQMVESLKLEDWVD